MWVKDVTVNIYCMYYYALYLELVRYTHLDETDVNRVQYSIVQLNLSTNKYICLFKAITAQTDYESNH